MNLQQTRLQTSSRTLYQSSDSDWKGTYVSVLAAITACIAYLDLASYYSILTKGAFLPKYAYFALGIAIAPLLIASNKALLSYLKSPFVVWAVAMVSLQFMHLLLHLVDDNADAAGMTLTRIQYLVLATLIGFLFAQTRPVFLGRVFVVLALLLTALQMIDFMFPGTIVPFGTEGIVLGRAGSTLINANKAAESLILLAVLGMAVLRPAWRIWLLLIVLPGVFLTFSRAGLLAWSIVVIAGFLFSLFSRSAYALVLVFIPLAVSSSAGMVGLILSYVDINALDNVYERVMFFFTLDTSDYSAQLRVTVADSAIDSFLAHPLFGNGAGFTHFWGVSDQAPHNQHLLMLAEYGIVGYGVFIWLIVVLLRGGGYFKSLQSQPITMVAFCVFLMYTPFTHNMFDSLSWLVSFALVGQQAMNVRG